MLILLRDPATLRPVAEVEDPLDWEFGESYWEAGDWSLEVASDTRAGWMIRNQPGLGVLVVDTDEEVVLYSGRSHIDDKQRDSTSDVTTLAGVDDHGRLAKINARPDTVNPPASWAQQSDTITGTLCGPAFESLVRNNVGPASLRPMAGLDVSTGSTAGLQIDLLLDGQPILDVFSQYGRTSDVFPRLRQTNHGRLFFSCPGIADRTDIVFSPQQGFEDYTRRRSGPTCTHVIVSDGTTTIEVAAPTDPNWPDRVEHFITVRDEPDLQVVGENYLAATKAATSIEFAYAVTPAPYKSAFSLGDIVTAELPDDEGRIPAQLTSARNVRVGDEGRWIFGIGDPSPETLQRQLVARLSLLERRA